MVRVAIYKYEFETLKVKMMRKAYIKYSNLSNPASLAATMKGEVVGSRFFESELNLGSLYGTFMPRRKIRTR
jgi:hypothetical protein